VSPLLIRTTQKEINCPWILAVHTFKLAQLNMDVFFFFTKMCALLGILILIVCLPMVQRGPTSVKKLFLLSLK